MYIICSEKVRNLLIINSTLQRRKLLLRSNLTIT